MPEMDAKFVLFIADIVNINQLRTWQCCYTSSINTDKSTFYISNIKPRKTKLLNFTQKMMISLTIE